MVMQNKRWWKESKDNLPKSVFSYIDNIRNYQGYKTRNNFLNMRLYGDIAPTIVNYFPYTMDSSSRPRFSFNVIKSVIDTVTSKMTKNKPKPTFLTEGGNFTEQRVAKKLDKYIEGVFYDMNYYQKAIMSFRDACIFNDGWIKFKKNHMKGKIECERVFPEEMVFDDYDCMHNSPRQLHQVKLINCDTLIAKYPKFKMEIERARKDVTNYHYIHYIPEAHANMIPVIESWHLPSNDDKKDGRHSICISNAILFDEKYTKCYFPFVKLDWNPRPLGYSSEGLAEQLSGIQLEINKLVRTIQIAMHLTSIPKIIAFNGAKVNAAHLNNQIGTMLKVAGSQGDVQFVSNIGGVSPELFNQLENLYNKAFELSGVSRLAATSKKPGGIESGKALREYNDIGSERFLFAGERYQQTFIDAAKIIINMSRDLYEDNKDLSVKYKGKKFIETIKWSDVDLKDDKFVMKIYPTSALADTPAGRLEDVRDLLNIAAIDTSDAVDLLDYPDLEKYNNLLTSSRKYIDYIIEEMLDKGKYVAPESYDNLELMMKKMTEAYNLAKINNTPEERLELMRRFLDECSSQVQQAMQPPVQPALPEPVPQPNVNVNPNITVNPEIGV